MKLATQVSLELHKKNKRLRNCVRTSERCREGRSNAVHTIIQQERSAAYHESADKCQCGVEVKVNGTQHHCDHHGRRVLVHISDVVQILEHCGLRLKQTVLSEQ